MEDWTKQGGMPPQFLQQMSGQPNSNDGPSSGFFQQAPNAGGPQRKPSHQEVAEMFTRMAEVAKARAAEEQPEMGTAETPNIGEDLNILPLPNTQYVGKTNMIWRWIVKDLETNLSYVVSATLCIRGADKGSYMVTLNQDKPIASSSRSSEYVFYNDMPKLLGQALVSAWNYKNIWKLHAGEFLEREISEEEVVMETEKVSARDVRRAKNITIDSVGEVASE